MINKAAIKLNLPDRLSALIPLLLFGRMRPSIFIAGFQKCGTTSLYDLITAHPSVVRGLRKENDDLMLNNIQRFLLSFPYKQGGKKTIDASHLPTWHPNGAHLIAQHFPDATVILIMRDPVRRALSHFEMDKRIGYVPSDMSLETYVNIELELRAHISDDFDLSEVHRKLKLYSNRYGWAVSRGIYAPYVSSFQNTGLKVLPVFLEDMEADFDQFWKGICQFLDLPEVSMQRRISNKSPKRLKMSPEMEVKLRSFYQPFNEHLETLIGRNLPF